MFFSVLRVAGSRSIPALSAKLHQRCKKQKALIYESLLLLFVREIVLELKLQRELNDARGFAGLDNRLRRRRRDSGAASLREEAGTNAW